MTIEDLRPHPCGVGRPPTPSHHTGIAPVVRAVWVAGSGLHITHHVQGWFPDSESVGSHQVWVLCVSKLSGV